MATHPPLVKTETTTKSARRRRDPILIGCCLLLLAGHAAITWANRAKVVRGYQDFAIFYAGAKILRDGLGANLYDFELQTAYMKEFSTRPIPLSFNHAPFELLFFLPFSFLPYLQGYFAWAVANVLLLFVIAFLLRPYCERVDRTLPVWLILLAFFPVFVSLLQGQDSILILLLYSVAFVSLRRGREFAAGAALALGLFKFQLVLPFMFAALVGKKWNMLRAFAIASVVLALLSFYLVGWKGVESYFELLRQQNKDLAEERTRSQWYIYPTAMANLRGFAAILFLGKIPEDALNLGILVCSLGLLIWSGRKWSVANGRENEILDLIFSLNVAVTLLASYHLYSHDVSLFILPVLLIANRLHRDAIRGKLATYGFAATILPFFLLPLQILLVFWYEASGLFFIPMFVFALLISREIGRLRTQTAPTT